MKIHEYQAREIFRNYGIPIPRSGVAATVEEAEAISRELGVRVVIKAQVHVGGRGKAGGVKFASGPAEVREVAGKILGMNIKGLTVRKVLVSESVDVTSEAYLGVIVDRGTQRPVVMVSAAGGIDIEEVARETPEKIHKLAVDPLLGLLPHQARQLAFQLYADSRLALKAAPVIEKLYHAFQGVDASLAEINPFVTTPGGDVLAIDAKINLDDNALYRRADLEALRDLEAEEPAEVEARKMGLSYVKLDGNIGCCVNGAGLAMATMDLIKSYGGEPANFLDIGGSSNPAKVTTAMRIILRDPNVRAILFNIFGGITRCDDVAQGIVESFSSMEIPVPVVVRLTGTNEDKAREILKKTTLVAARTMADGAQMSIELASRKP
jgi:succinyl-CoA synthetase beta subunit